MATVTQWTPFGVALNITATASTVTRTSATQYTVKINVSWESYWGSAKTNYGMVASSGGASVTINQFGTKASSGSGTLTGTYSISGNGSATKTVTVAFRNFNNDNGDSATKNVSFTVTVPAWTSYTVTYNANGGSGAPGSQTKWKNQTLTLSSTKPTRTGYSFQGWATSSTGSVAYASGASYTANAAVTLYAVWKANTYTVTYNANGGSGAPANQTKTYGTSLTLSSTKPTRTDYNFKGWGTSAGATTVAYAAGASYTANAAITLYAIWELAYVKPRITGFSIARCDSEGVVSDSGTYILVKCNWACDKTVSSIKINWKLASSTTYSNSSTVTASGTSGTVNSTIGAGAISTENTYNIQVVVTDGSGNTSVMGTIQGISYPIDIKGDGKGIAFGKPAETTDLAECNYNFQVNKFLTLGKPVNDSTPMEGGIRIHDLRACTPLPRMFGGRSINAYFDTITPLPGSWRSIVSITGWSGDSYATHEIAFNSSSGSDTNDQIFHRGGNASTWRDWRKVYDSVNHGSNKTLWSGTMTMNSSQTATLSSAISDQAHGIVLVFSEYVDSAAQDYCWHSFFVPKKVVSVANGTGHSFGLQTGSYGYMATKYLYIHDTKIVGHANNSTTGTAGSGVEHTNGRFVLRYVLGV